MRTLASFRDVIAGIPLIGPSLRVVYHTAQRIAGVPIGAAAVAQAHAFRYALAEKHLAGDGIELGALHAPLKVPPRARVKYVDRMSVADLRVQYPELQNSALVEPDIIDDGEKLSTQQQNSQDFIIANHFIEHAQDPIRTIQRFLEVLRPAGIIYLAVPDKRWTFDKGRDVTPLEHLYRDYHEGPAWSYRQHFEEWAEHVQGLRGERARQSVEKLISQDYSIHFHVWTQDHLVEMITDLRKTLGLPLELVEMQTNRALGEVICILRKSA